MDPEEEEDSSVTFPDLMEECSLWDYAGVTIGRTEVRIIPLDFTSIFLHSLLNLFQLKLFNLFQL